MPPVGPAVLSSTGGHTGIGRSKAENRSRYEDAVRRAERQGSEEVKNKGQHEEKVKALTVQPSQPVPHMGCLGFVLVFSLMATLDLAAPFLPPLT